MTPDVVSVRQNLVPLVDGGVVNPTCATGGTAQWGSTVGQAAYIHRSAFGVTRTGAMIYIGGPALSVCTLGDLLRSAGSSGVWSSTSTRRGSRVCTFTPTVVPVPTRSVCSPTGRSGRSTTCRPRAGTSSPSISGPWPTPRARHPRHPTPRSRGRDVATTDPEHGARSAARVMTAGSAPCRRAPGPVGSQPTGAPRWVTSHRSALSRRGLAWMGQDGRVRSVSSARRTRLVAPRLRFPVAVVAVVAAVGVIVLGVHFAGDTHAGPLDRTLGGPLDMRHGLVKVLGQGFADLGNPLPVALALVVLAGTAFAVRGPRGLALALGGPVLAMAATSLVLKPIVDRTRSGELAFPSGHTTAIASLAVAAGTLLLGWTIVSASCGTWGRRRSRRWSLPSQRPWSAGATTTPPTPWAGSVSPSPSCSWSPWASMWPAIVPGVGARTRLPRPDPVGRTSATPAAAPLRPPRRRVEPVTPSSRSRGRTVAAYGGGSCRARREGGFETARGRGDPLDRGAGAHGLGAADLRERAQADRD